MMYYIIAGLLRKEVADDIASLLALRWWDWPAEKISANIKYIQLGNIESLKKQCNISRGRGG